MELDIVSYHNLSFDTLKNALFNKGIVGIRDVPGFLEASRAYVNAARRFAALDEATKKQYAPDRDSGETEGYELGAEWFKDKNGEWKIDDKKASYYAFVPDRARNKWPTEVDLKTAYLALCELIFSTGKHVLNALGLNETIGMRHDGLLGCCRMLHYHKEKDTFQDNQNWCGAHFDHSVITGLLPSYYFQDGREVLEPEEAGLFILPPHGKEFEKINAADKSILLFQVGEFGQLALNDQIRATRHLVRKAKANNIERFTLALFYDAAKNTLIRSTSELTKDARYANNMAEDGSIRYEQWEEASYARYRASQAPNS